MTSTPPILNQILSLPAYDLQALALLHQHQAGIPIDWTEATQAMHDLRTYTANCEALTKTITRLSPSPATDTHLLLTTML
jgi:hypothetical protein